MPKLLKILILFLISAYVLSSCRPPELEGAYLHIKNEQWDEALELAKKVTLTYPENSEGWYTLGYIYGKKDSIKAMLAAYDKSQSIDNTHDTQIKEEKFDYYARKFNNGAAKYNEYLAQEDPNSESSIAIINEAIKSFNQANMLNPNFRAVNLAAQAYSIIGKKEQALAKYKDLTETYPDSSSSWINLGKYYYNNKEYDNAIQNFKKANTIDSSKAETYSFIAQSYDLLDKPEKAIPYYETAVMLNEEDSATSFNLGLLFYKLAIGTSDLEKKNEYFSKAIDNFDLSIQYNDEFMSSYQLKGNAELLLKRYEDSRETLEIGTQKFPNDAQMWNDLSICYAILNIQDKAKAAEARARELEKNN